MTAQPGKKLHDSAGRMPQALHELLANTPLQQQLCKGRRAVERQHDAALRQGRGEDLVQLPVQEPVEARHCPRCAGASISHQLLM